jgi:hypothetical protein
MIRMLPADQKELIMTTTITSSMKSALVLDAVASGAMAVLAIGGASLLAPLLGLPQALLFWAGVAMLPWVALLIALARRQSAPRLILVDVVALNALWVAASLALLVSGLVAPTALGTAFVVAQALAVAAFATLQFSALRRATTAAASA